MVVRALSSLFTHLTFAAEKNHPLLALSKLSMVKTKPELKVFSPNKTCHRHCHCQILLKYPRSLWINQEVVFGFKCCCPEKIFTCLPVVQKGQTEGGMSGRSRSLSMKCGCSSSQWSSQIEWPGKLNLISISSLLHANPLTSPLFHLRLLFSSIASLDR